MLLRLRRKPLPKAAAAETAKQSPGAMARAATGLAEAVCWQFIAGGIGGVAALIFFLVVGAMNGMAPKEKPIERVAAKFQPSLCTTWDDSSTACTELKTYIDTNLPDVRTKLLDQPCELDEHATEVVAAKLAFYWKARCRPVYARMNCATEADRDGCEKDLAKLEASCAFLGLAQDPMFLKANDVDTPEVCLTYLKANTVTQGEADRCATSPSMAWETLNFMTGGDQVTSNRCNAVTFAALVYQGSTWSTCGDTGSYNFGVGSAPRAELCGARRTCPDQILSDLVDAVPYGKSETTFETWTAMDSTTKIAIATCVTGYEARGSTDEYYCSHVPYTDSAGYPIDVLDQPVTDTANAIGTWVGGLQCKRRSCPDQCGSALGDFMTGDETRTSRRDPPEGLTDTCCSGRFGDTCQIKCQRGYRPEADPADPSRQLPLTCDVDPNNPSNPPGVHETQLPPVWAGTSCEAKACYRAVVANAATTASDVVGQEATLGACDADYMEVGTGAAGDFTGLSCQPSLLFQGGGCSSRPTASITDNAFVQSRNVGSSSNTGLALDAFDNDPMTYWYSTRADANSADSPDSLTIEVPDAIVPLGVSIQLGKSTDWTSFRILPKAFRFMGCENPTNCDWVTLFSVTEQADTWTLEDDTLTNWFPACNDVSVDPIGCTDAQFEIDCPSDPNRDGQCGGHSINSNGDEEPFPCNYPVAVENDPAVQYGKVLADPTATFCGPTEFSIRPGKGAFKKFKLEITDEYTEFNLAGDRYGQVYIQDIAIMSAASIRSSAQSGAKVFSPETTTCCGALGNCGASGAGNGILIRDDDNVMSYADCVEQVALGNRNNGDVGTYEFMQFHENTDASSAAYGLGYCYGLDNKVEGPQDLTAPVILGGYIGGLCWKVFN